MATILIVDDEPSARTTLGLLLKKRSHRVTEVEGVAAALKALTDDAFDVIVTDLRMPDGDGLDVLRAALLVETPVIMVTGYGSAATRRLALDEGAVGFLAKPFSAYELLELVRNIVGDGSGPVTLPPPPGQPRPGIHC